MQSTETTFTGICGYHELADYSDPSIFIIIIIIIIIIILFSDGIQLAKGGFQWSPPK